MEVIKIPAGVYAANCYLIYKKNSGEAVIIDPGGDAEYIISKIEELGLDLKYIILTHGHADHIAGVKEIKEYFNIPVAIHKDDNDMLGNSCKNFSKIMAMGRVEIEADILLEDGDYLEFGETFANIIHTPGHTQGGISVSIGNCLFTGDTLFSGSIGRTDFPKGSSKKLINSIKNQLLAYPNDTIVYPGHGSSTTIGREKDNNPFLK